MSKKHVAVVALLINTAVSNFYMKIDLIERCVVDSFKKNQEVMIKLE